MGRPWVYSVTLAPDNKMTLSVEVTDVKNTTGAIEITGEVTQVNGAWARISSVTDIANATEGNANDPDQKGKLFINNVEAVPTKDHPFDPNEDFTVFVRVSKVWVSVLERKRSESGGPEAEFPTWEYKADSQL